MRVFRLRADSSRFQALSLKHEKNVKYFMDWDGQSLGASWKPIEVEIFEEYEEALPSDFPEFGGDPTFSKRALGALSDLLDKNGELLPLKCKEGTYFVYNVTCVLDALDRERSTFEKSMFEEDQDVSLVEKYVFIPERLSGAVIFKLLWNYQGRRLTEPGVFVTDVFVERVKLAKLVGFEFEKVWQNTAKPKKPRKKRK